MTLENKNTKLNDLKGQLSKAFSEIDTLKHDLNLAQFGCQQCDYKAYTEELLQKHIHQKHEPNCKFCERTFETSEELGKHTCKISITNAEFKQFYLKNWILTHGCTRIFNKHRKKEVAILHIEKCWIHVVPCRELPDWHTPDAQCMTSMVFFMQKDISLYRMECFNGQLYSKNFETENYLQTHMPNTHT